MTTTTESRFRRRNYGRNHGYLLDGRRIIGVTTAINLGVPKDALVGWAARTAADYAVSRWEELSSLSSDEKHRAISTAHEQARNFAAVKGTTVHEMGARLVRGELVEGIPDEVAKKVDAYVAWLNKFQVVPVLVEAAVCNLEHEYGGTLDLVFTSPRFPGRTFLADLKTSKGVYGETALQLEGYARADIFIDPEGNEVPMDGLRITDHVVVHIEDSGVRVYEMHSGDEVWSVFQSVLGVARARDGKRGETEIDAFMIGELFAPGEGWL